MADIAGIIEEAHQGAGLGHKFLKHIERTKVLIHVVDVSGSEGRDPAEDFEKINDELRKYSPSLMKKPQIVAANKTDLLEAGDERYEEFRKFAEGKGYEVFPVSAASGKGIKELMAKAAEALQKAEAEPQEDEYEMFDFAADEADPDYRSVKAEFDGRDYILSGKRLEKIFDSTNFNDPGSLRYLSGI